MANRRPSGKSSVPVCVLLLATFFLFPACGGSGYGGGGGGGQNPPSAPTGLSATAGNQQVSLTWAASSGATSYNVKRATASGGPYTTVVSPTGTSQTDTGLTNGTTYYYVVSAVNSVGESANSSQASATPGVVPAVPTGLTATAGNQQVSLSWTASSGATSYHLKRSTTSGGPYTTVASPTGTSQTDSGLTNGTAYYYVVSAVNATGESANSSPQVSATPAAMTSVTATINVLANRHTISPYIYGGAFPESAAKITDSGLPVVRWGGNATSTYNWQLHTYNADNDYYFEDFNFSGIGNGDADSAQFITDVKAAGSAPLMTMVMLPWVAQSAEVAGAGGNGHWSFPQTEYPNQCAFDPFNTDAGNGIVAGTCSNNPQTFITATAADINRTYFPLLDQPGTSDPANSVYRNQWAAALATAFGSGTCAIPNSAITSCHFYDMDNEIDIWGGTHRDVHPNPATYQELRDIFVKESAALKGWDPAAVRLGPVSCCWYFYWRSATGASDTSSHGGVDFLPWWLNEVAWSDALSGSRTLDMLDIHAYPDGPDPTTLTLAQQRALATRIYRDWWDPTYTSEATYIANGGFSIEPVDSKPFRIPRMRALVNQIYPGTAFAMTEWSAELAGTTGAQRATDFSTALGDADAYGILGRERVSLSTRWTAPVSTNPNYQALKLFTSYGFGTTSVQATHNGDPNLFSVYAALNSAGTSLTIMVVNKDPANVAQVAFTTPGFTASGTESTYTLSQSSPTAIVAASGSWSATQTFAPYTATLLVVPGSVAAAPASEWDLNPDTIMVPAGGTVTLSPMITKGTTNVALTTAVFDVFEGAPACTGGTITLTTSTITTAASGQITVIAPATPGFCHYTVTGSDGIATQTEGGWIVVGKPAATFTKTGDNQSGAVGTQLNLSVSLSPGSSGGTALGASVLFSANAGSLSNGTTSGAKVIAVTNNSGVASVTLTLPGAAQVVTVNAEGPYGLGHPEAAFTETAH